jgi:hypothetical protein
MTATNKAARIALKGRRLGDKLCEDANPVICTTTEAGYWSSFTVEALGGQQIALRSGRSGKYCSDTPDGMTCNADRIDTWEIFTWEEVSAPSL